MELEPEEYLLMDDPCKLLLLEDSDTDILAPADCLHDRELTFCDDEGISVAQQISACVLIQEACGGG